MGTYDIRVWCALAAVAGPLTVQTSGTSPCSRGVASACPHGSSGVGWLCFGQATVEPPDSSCAPLAIEVVLTSRSGSCDSHQFLDRLLLEWSLLAPNSVS